MEDRKEIVCISCDKNPHNFRVIAETIILNRHLVGVRGGWHGEVKIFTEQPGLAARAFREEILENEGCFLHGRVTGITQSGDRLYVVDVASDSGQIRFVADWRKRPSYVEAQKVEQMLSLLVGADVVECDRQFDHLVKRGWQLKEAPVAV